MLLLLLRKSALIAPLCRSVVAIEPVPLFRAFLEYSAARNHLTHLIEVLPALVAANAARPYVVNVPLAGSWGQAGVHVRQEATHTMLQVCDLGSEFNWMLFSRPCSVPLALTA
jgi:hypothetical protein